MDETESTNAFYAFIYVHVCPGDGRINVCRGKSTQEIFLGVPAMLFNSISCSALLIGRLWFKCFDGGCSKEMVSCVVSVVVSCQDGR